MDHAEYFEDLWFYFTSASILAGSCDHETSNGSREVSHHYLEQTYTTYSNCIIHIVDLQGDLELPPATDVPIVVDVWPKLLDTLGKSQLHDKPDIAVDIMKDVMNAHVRNTSGVAYIKHFTCLATFLAVSNFQTFSNFNEFKKHKEYFSHQVAFWTVIRQDVTLGLEIPWVNLPQMKYYGMITRYFSESLIMLNIDSNFDVSEASKKLTMTDTVLFRSSTHLPTITIILIKRNQALANCKAALLFCMYCNDAHRFVPLDCHNAIGSTELTISTFANQVPWMDFSRKPWDPATKLCPLTLWAKRSDKCSSKKLNVASLALSVLNLTQLARRPDFIYFSNLRIPNLHLGPSYLDGHLEDVAGAIMEDSQFGLITSDGLLEENKGNYFGSLIQPFSVPVWAVVCIAAIGVAFSTSEFTANWRCMNKLALSMLSAGLVLIEQLQNVSTSQNEGAGRTRGCNSGLKTRVVSAFWLITAFLITNWYKCEFKSNLHEKLDNGDDRYERFHILRWRCR